MLKEKKSDPIIMVDKTHIDAEGKRYEDETTTSINETTVHDDKQTITFNLDSSAIRSSNRHKKPPKSMTNDFLW